MQGLQQQHVQLSMVGHSPLKPLSMITFSFIISINVLKKNLVKFNCQSSKFSGYDIREPSPISCFLFPPPASLLLSPVSYMPPPVSCLLTTLPVPRLLSHVSCPMSLVSSLLSFISCLTSSVSWLLSPFSCLPSTVSLLLSPFSCPLSPVSGLLSHVSCLLSHVFCLLSHVSFTSPV